MVLLPEPETPITINAHGVCGLSPLTKILRKRRLVDEPDGLARRSRAARGQVFVPQPPSARLLLWRERQETATPYGRQVRRPSAPRRTTAWRTRVRQRHKTIA